ncbi:uncharacterized protein [Branchiostoma lanceolatum]|uniref:uncharacterized protein n=1 Tax=Branchiostoma lanceolatum TaxID=7740 RepID=UPI00345398DA
MSSISRFPPLQVSSLMESDKIRPRSHEIPRQTQEAEESPEKRRPKSQELPAIRGASRAGWRTAKSRVVSRTRAGRDTGLSLKPPPHTGLRARSGWEKQDGTRTPSEDMDDRNRSSRNRFYRTAAMATRSQTLLDIGRHLVPSPNAVQGQRRENDTSSQSDYQEKKLETKIDKARNEKYERQSTLNVTLTSSTVRLTQETEREKTPYSPIVNEISRKDSNGREEKEDCSLFHLNKKQPDSTAGDRISGGDANDLEEEEDYYLIHLNKKQQPASAKTFGSSSVDRISREDGKDREEKEEYAQMQLNKKQQPIGAESCKSSVNSTIVNRFSREDGNDKEETEDSNLSKLNTAPLVKEATNDAYLSAGLSYGYKLWNEISRWGNQNSSRFSHSLKLLDRIESGIGNMLGETKTTQDVKCEGEENSSSNLQNSENTSHDPSESASTCVNEEKEDLNYEGKEQIFTSQGSDETDHNTASKDVPSRKYSKAASHANSWCQSSHDDYYVTTLEDKRPPRHPAKGRQKNGRTVASGELNTYEDYFISLDSKSKFKRV